MESQEISKNFSEGFFFLKAWPIIIDNSFKKKAERRISQENLSVLKKNYFRKRLRLN
jgi:hypothetical protein